MVPLRATPLWDLPLALPPERALAIYTTATKNPEKKLTKKVTKTARKKANNCNTGLNG
jgi:hypothetical protein